MDFVFGTIKKEYSDEIFCINSMSSMLHFLKTVERNCYETAMLVGDGTSSAWRMVSDLYSLLCGAWW
jgi:hypothetical protein